VPGVRDAVPRLDRPGRPRIYCGDQCRWKAGHQAAAERASQRNAEWADWSFDDLLAWAGTQDFREPY
jgi:hypothetical protein